MFQVVSILFTCRRLWLLVQFEQSSLFSIALHLSTTKNQRGVCVTTGASPVGDIGESWAETTAKGERRVPLLLDMQLQGALLPTVNQGPMAYAHAFLAASRSNMHPPEKIGRLKRLFL